MPQSLRKSFTAWLQLPALPPTPKRNSLPPRSRSAASSPTSLSTVSTSTVAQIFSTSFRKSRLCEDIIGLSIFSSSISKAFQCYRRTGASDPLEQIDCGAPVRPLPQRQYQSTLGPCGRAYQARLRRVHYLKR